MIARTTFTSQIAQNRRRSVVLLVILGMVLSGALLQESMLVQNVLVRWLRHMRIHEWPRAWENNQNA